MHKFFVVPYSAANFDGSKKGQAAGIFNSSSAAEINTWVDWATNLGKGVVNPDVFYSKQLLDTIRFDADEYSYYRLADEMPIGDKADELVVRRWSPLRAHTVPLDEGVPPQTDRGQAKTYKMSAKAYGRYMEFSDKVDFNCVDSVIAHYANEYAIVAIETLDLLAQEELLDKAQKWFAGSGVTKIDDMLPYDNTKPAIEDFRLMGMALKKAFVKPRANGRYHAIVSPEFSYDMLNDPYVTSYMTINQSTYGFYDNAVLCPMFGFDFYEVNNCPQGVAFPVVSGGVTYQKCRVYIDDVTALANIITDPTKVQTGWTYVAAVTTGNVHPAYIYKDITITSGNAATAAGYDTADYVGIKGSKRTYGEFPSGANHNGTTPSSTTLSYIPSHTDYDLGAWVAIKADADFASTSTTKISTATGESTLIKDTEAKIMTFQHTIVVGKDALVRTGMSGEGQARMYTKALGSAGVLDPIDQRQSIGFKINSVGFCAGITPNAVYDYINIPTQLRDENVFIGANL